jgi:PD-(D/E)XK nuclease superfamily
MGCATRRGVNPENLLRLRIFGVIDRNKNGWSQQVILLYTTVLRYVVYMEPIKTNETRQRAHAWSHLVIGAAIEVHRIKGPGLIESIYSKCFLRECDLRSIPVRRELLVPIE